MLNITPMLAYKGSKCRPGYKLAPKYVTIHNTGNTTKGSDADNHARYLQNGGRDQVVGYHYCVDDHQIIQIIPDNENAWHAGDGSNGIGNRQSLAIEICENSDGDILKATNNAVELTAMLVIKYNIPFDKIVQHNYWIGKDCPRQIRKNNPYSWKEFINRVKSKVNSQVNTENVTTTVKTYKVLVDINKYNSAEDARNRTNALPEKLKAGTYYIYTKYPDGFNGVYNITSAKDGKSAGSWINPIENVISVNTNLYRVRKSKDDAKSQIGAYSVLENAKEACDKAGNGYHVFDKDYKIVYSYKASTTQAPTTQPEKEEVKVTAVYDLDYPIRTKIVDKEVAVPKNVRAEQCVKAVKLIQQNNKEFDENIAIAFYEISYSFDIDPNMVIAQSILETGWFKFEGSAVKPNQYNYCGLGVTSNGVIGAQFENPSQGITAQLQHLYAYACKDELPETYSTIYDPRFKYVTRGIAPYWQNLAGRWAVPGYDTKMYDTPQKAMEAENTYGQKIYNIAKQIQAVEITEQEYNEFWGLQLVEPPVVVESTDKQTSIQWVVNMLKTIADVLLNLFNK